MSSAGKPPPPQNQGIEMTCQAGLQNIFGHTQLAGLGFDYADTFLSAVKRVDKDDVTRVASEWLTDPATVLVVPGKSAPPRTSTKRAGI